MLNNLRVFPHRINNIYKINFAGKSDSEKKPTPLKLPTVENKTPKSKNPVLLPGVSYDLAVKIIEAANKSKSTIDNFLKINLALLSYTPQISPELSKTAKVGQTTITTLIDGEQIFDKTVEYLKSAKDSIQIEMFEFQNLKIDGNKWPTNGAEVVPGFQKQQSILSILVRKKRENPDIKIQVILDAHKWYINGYGEKVRHYNNQDMIKYLKENDIDVVPYPRAAQKGAALQHVKFLAVDGKKAIIGGMNWGTHSVANHDACVAVETQPKYKNSEVDNMIEDIFNKDWKFAWQRLGQEKMIPGPLNEQEQKFYSGLRKEIKEENKAYMEVVGKLFNTKENKNRYKDGKLDLIQTNPIKNPQIRIFTTKPNELEFVNEKGQEGTREYLKEKLSTAKKVRGELFVLSDKELIEKIVQRHKNGELDAKFIVASEILEEFPYCRKAYNQLVKHNVPVRLYNFDERVNQRLHAKWAVFDDKEVLIGSTNWSAMGLNQNLKKGMREDYELYVEKINGEIKEYLLNVKPFEEKLGIPPLANEKINYGKLMQRRKIFRKALTELAKKGVEDSNDVTVLLNDKEYNIPKDQRGTLLTVQGYYKIIKDRNNAKEKYKRGNNECAIVFEKPILAKVFLKQFDKDWKFSEDDFDNLRKKVISSRLPEELSSDIVEGQ